MSRPSRPDGPPPLHLRPNCTTCHYPLWDVNGTGRHPTDRCDPEGRVPWWERPEWQEWLGTAALRPTETPSRIAASGLDPAAPSEET